MNERTQEQQLEHILKKILEKNPATKQEFDVVRKLVCKELHVSYPSNRTLLKTYHTLIANGSLTPTKDIEKLISKANIRSLSGVAIITSLVKPYSCPGKCVYCPTEIRMPKSYIASEPAAARAQLLDFSPYEQMRRRIEALAESGHPTDKIEFIIKGGTWNAYPLPYQYWFILESFKACNNLSRKVPLPESTEADFTSIEELQTALKAEQTYNETATHRIIGITLETRPDAIHPNTIHHMREQGCTRIELGLQAPDDHILALIKRGHTVQQFTEAMSMLRAAGFKVDLHFMPDLPGSNAAHDVEMYASLFSNPLLRPDMVKIYPCAVIPSAELYDWYTRGIYKPYGSAQLFDALLEMKKITPRYCRISRLIRDIPANEIAAGNNITNLREALAEKLHEQGLVCECLRCREIGRHPDLAQKKRYTYTDAYEASGGTEIFLSSEDADRIAVFAFLRLRLPPIIDDATTPFEHKVKKLFALMPEIKDCAFIRELHTYGHLVQIGKYKDSASQHTGLGRQLLEEAEKIAIHAGYKKIAVISGVGVRDYYRKFGYELEGTYMTKSLILDKN